MAGLKASGFPQTVLFITVLIMVTFSAATEKPTEGTCSKPNNNNTALCEGVEGLKFSNVSKAASISFPRGSSTATPATKVPSRGVGTVIPRSPSRSDDGSSDNYKSMGAPLIISLQALLLVISCISFLFIVFSS